MFMQSAFAFTCRWQAYNLLRTVPARKSKSRSWCLLVLVACVAALSSSKSNLTNYKGRPFQDSHYRGGAQKIPGRVECAYYDLGGERVAYHDLDAKNSGSGNLNP